MPNALKTNSAVIDLYKPIGGKKSRCATLMGAFFNVLLQTYQNPPLPKTVVIIYKHNIGNRFPYFSLEE
jgi:hypothetical protein